MVDEPPTTLYDVGWRQGRLARASLPLPQVDLDTEGRVALLQQPHDLWVVATQDCDLDLLSGADDAASVELRPVYEREQGDWGIRSRWFRLSGRYFTHADRPRLHVSPRTLERAAQEPLLDEVRVVAFKTWLGLRYDRPAVPPELLPLMRAIGDEVHADRHALAHVTRDVLVQVEQEDGHVRYSLFGVVLDDSHVEDVRRWLADLATRVAIELGVADEIEAATPAGISLQLIETSYAADVTRITWRGSRPEPHGGY